MNRKQKRLVRVIAIVLAALMASGAVISAIISFAYAEEAPAPKLNQYELTMEYLYEEQALRMSQRLVYTNTSSRKLDRVVFYAPANMFRRQSALFYESPALQQAFPAGYLPGGIDLTSVQVNGTATDWGYQGTDEIYLRVACDLESGESCEFQFDYYLLLTENMAFCGVSENECRLSDFYFAPAAIDASGEFILNAPLAFTRYINTPAADFHAKILLPEGTALASSGIESCISNENGVCRWEIEALNVRDFALLFGTRSHQESMITTSGVQIRCLTNLRQVSDDVLEIAADAIKICEGWFGPLPRRQIAIIQADHAPGPLNHTACLWLPESILKEGGRELEHAIRVFIAQQYFGRSAWVNPVSDAWLSDSISEYIAYLLLEESEGHDAYLMALNEEIVDSLQLTIPGGLVVSSDASLFTAYEYDIVVRQRGAAVFHELYTAMGRDDLIAAMGLLYHKGLIVDTLTEMDLVYALDEASGKHWEKFLTDWVFNIGDYVNQEIDWLE